MSSSSNKSTTKSTSLLCSIAYEVRKVAFRDIAPHPSSLVLPPWGFAPQTQNLFDSILKTLMFATCARRR